MMRGIGTWGWLGGNVVVVVGSAVTDAAATPADQSGTTRAASVTPAMARRRAPRWPRLLRLRFASLLRLRTSAPTRWCPTRRFGRRPDPRAPRSAAAGPRRDRR